MLILTYLLKSCLSTLKNCELSSRRAIVAALGESLTNASLPKSSPSCKVLTIPLKKIILLLINYNFKKKF